MSGKQCPIDKDDLRRNDGRQNTEVPEKSP